MKLSSFAYGTLQEISLRNRIIDNLTKNGITNFRILPSYKTYSYKLKKNADIDLLLITECGVYAIEIKSFVSKIIGKYSDKMWKGISFKNCTMVFNPVFQNKEHIRSLNTVLRRNGYEALPISNIVCVQNGCKRISDCEEVVSESMLLSRILMDLRFKEKVIDVKHCMEVLVRLSM